MTSKPDDKQGPVLTTAGNRLCLDGDPVDVWGIRTSSATASDEQCQHLIDQLDKYVAHGVNAVTVFYQICMGANYDPFAADGANSTPTTAVGWSASSRPAPNGRFSSSPGSSTRAHRLVWRMARRSARPSTA